MHPPPRFYYCFSLLKKLPSKLDNLVKTLTKQSILFEKDMLEQEGIEEPRSGKGRNDSKRQHNQSSVG